MAEKKEDALRKNIEAKIEQTEGQKKAENFKKRLDVAKKGITHYSRNQHGEAVAYFRNYLELLEHAKDAPVGGLHPRMFTAKEDVPELLLLSGILWDLAKIFDKTSSENKIKEFKLYIDKYVLFSKGQPFQSLSAEALRKYLAGGKAVHRKEIRNAYQQLETSKCFIATALEDDLLTSTKPALVYFRESHLRPYRLGRAFIRIYESLSPWVSRGLIKMPSFFRKKIAKILDWVAQLVQDRANT